MGGHAPLIDFWGNREICLVSKMFQKKGSRKPQVPQVPHLPEGPQAPQVPKLL